jgi:hypothetical protein
MKYLNINQKSVFLCKILRHKNHISGLLIQFSMDLPSGLDPR